MPNDQPPETAIVPAEPQAPDPQAPAPLAPLQQVAQNVAMLKPKEDPLVTVSAKSLADVLPLKFYEGASELKLTDEELDSLREYADADDDIVDIRPDGLIYVQHIHYRRALTALFGTEWALLPGSGLASPPLKMTVYQRWVLIVRGKFIGEAVGAATYFEDDKWSDKSFATEGAVSEAVRRICAKSALGIFSNVWDRKFARDWKRRNAIQVWAPSKGERKKLWRRKDDDPFEGEIGPVQKELAGKESHVPKSEPSIAGPDSGKEGLGVDPQLPQTQVPNGATKETGAPPRVSPKPMTTEPATPEAAAAPTAEMVTDGNFRLFILECRRKKLVEGDSAAGAIQLICDAIPGASIKPKAGAKQIEVLRALFFERTRKEFNEALLPALKAKD